MNLNQSRLKELSSHRYLIVTLIISAIYIGLFTFFSIQKHLSYHSGFDLAIYEQLFWTTTFQGTIFYSTLEGVNTFAVHFSPILFSLIPIYFLFPSTETLFFIQSFLLGIAAIPLFYIGRLLLNEKAGLIISAAYLMYPALHGVNLTDFHILCFAPVFFFFSFYFLEKDNFNYFLLFSILLISIREDLIPVSILLSMYGIWRAKLRQTRYLPYLVVAVVTILWFAVIMLVLMPSYLPAGISPSTYNLDRYQGAIENIGQNQSYRITHVLLLFSPLLLLPFFSLPALLTGLSGFLEIFLSSSPFYYSIEYQYSALIIPSIFVATISTLSKIKNSDNVRISKSFNLILYLLIISGIICMILFSPSPIRTGPFHQAYDPTITSHHQELKEIISIIPPDSAVATQDDILPHLSRRMSLYRGFDARAEYIIADNQTKFVDIFHDSAKTLSHWKVLFSERGITLFQRPSA